MTAPRVVTCWADVLELHVGDRFTYRGREYAFAGLEGASRRRGPAINDLLRGDCRAKYGPDRVSFRAWNTRGEQRRLLTWVTVNDPRD